MGAATLRNSTLCQAWAHGHLGEMALPTLAPKHSPLPGTDGWAQLGPLAETVAKPQRTRCSGKKGHELHFPAEFCSQQGCRHSRPAPPPHTGLPHGRSPRLGRLETHKHPAQGARPSVAEPRGLPAPKQQRGKRDVLIPVQWAGPSGFPPLALTAEHAGGECASILNGLFTRNKPQPGSPRRSQGLHLPAWWHGHPKWGSKGSRAQGQDHSWRCHPTRGHKMGIPCPKALVTQNEKAVPGVCSPGWQLSRWGTGAGLCEVQWCHIFSLDPGDQQSSGRRSCSTTPLLPSTLNTTSKTQARKTEIKIQVQGVRNLNSHWALCDSTSRLDTGPPCAGC